MINYLDYIKNNKIIPNNLIKNKYIDYSTNKLKIDIIILIYFYEKKNQRYYFQDFIFNYWNQLKKIFSNYIDFSFTIVGSEKNLSQSLSNKYFKKYEYYEFYQDPKLKTLNMLTNKINYAFKKSYEKNVDLLLWFGSNDYVCAHYFTNILEKYNNGFQQYGITDFFNGNNFCLYIELKNFIFNLDNFYIHNGIHNYCHRKKYKYIGGTHGYSKKILDKFPEILDKITCDEGANEYLVTKLIEKYPKLNINSMKTNDCFFFNVKFGNDEIHSFEILKKLNKNNILDFNKVINNYNIFLKNLIYIQKYNINLYDILKNELIIKINNYILVINTYINNIDLIKEFKNIEDEIKINKIIKKIKNDKNNDFKFDIQDKYNILENRYNLLIELLINNYKKKEIKFKIYSKSNILKKIKKFINNFKNNSINISNYDSNIEDKEFYINKIKNLLKNI